MRILKGLAILLAGVVLAGGIYGWGAGWFYPCGPLDRLVSISRCTVIAKFDDRIPQALLRESDGDLLAVLRQDGRNPALPQQLVELSLDGQVRAEVELTGVPPEANWMAAALSPDDGRIAASLFDAMAQVLDRATGATVTEIPVRNAALVGFDGTDRVMIERGIESTERPPEPAADIFSALDGSAQGEMTNAATTALHSHGLTKALSADGKMLAQHVETRGDSGVVAVRLADAAYPAWSGRLITAPLSSWLRHLLPELWFSPDGQYLAASFDSAPVWGKDTSALVVWDLGDSRVVVQIPTNEGEWDNLVWLDDRRLALSRFNLVTRKAEIAVIRYRMGGA